MYRATLLCTLLLVHLFMTPSVIMAFADPPAVAQVHVDQQALEEIHTRLYVN
jgi:TRAP-type mannitol/chloroaromatic compound transport system permease large subunit